MQDKLFEKEARKARLPGDGRVDPVPGRRAAGECRDGRGPSRHRRRLRRRRRSFRGSRTRSRSSSSASTRATCRTRSSCGPGSDINEVSKLAGKTVGVPIATSAHYTLATVVQDQTGKSLQELGVKLVNMTPAEGIKMPPGLDAAAVWVPSASWTSRSARRDLLIDSSGFTGPAHSAEGQAHRRRRRRPGAIRKAICSTGSTCARARRSPRSIPTCWSRSCARGSRRSGSPSPIRTRRSRRRTSRGSSIRPSRRRRATRTRRTPTSATCRSCSKCDALAIVKSVGVLRLDSARSTGPSPGPSVKAVMHAGCGDPEEGVGGRRHRSRRSPRWRRTSRARTRPGPS